MIDETGTPSGELSVEDLADALANAGEAAAAEGRPGLEVEKGKKRKTRNAPKVEAEPATISYSGEELTPLVQALDGWAASAFRVTPKNVDQCREISAALAPVLTKYAGASIERWGPELALVAVLAKHYVPTYLEFQMREKMRKAEEQEPVVVSPAPARETKRGPLTAELP